MEETSCFCGYCTKATNLPLPGCICPACGAATERASMVATGRALLYLTWDEVFARYVVTDWPGMLRFVASRHSRGWHNIARTQDHVWFTGPDGQPWHGVTYGDQTQLCHCRRLATRQAA